MSDKYEQLELFDARGDKAASEAPHDASAPPPCHAPDPEMNPSSSQAERSSTGRDETNIYRFPVDRWAPSLWRGKVEKVARLLSERKTSRGRQNLWRSTTDQLFAQMKRRGATGEEIERQIGDFHAAVSWQLSGHQSGPGAA